MKLPFRDAVRAGDLLFVSGQIGLKEDRTVPDTLEEEAHLLMRAIKGVLERHGASMRRLVQVTIYTPDIGNFEAFNAVYRTYFEDAELPTRAFLGSGPLLFGARFEATAIASMGAT